MRRPRGAAVAPTDPRLLAERRHREPFLRVVRSRSHVALLLIAACATLLLVVQMLHLGGENGDDQAVAATENNNSPPMPPPSPTPPPPVAAGLLDVSPSHVVATPPPPPPPPPPTQPPRPPVGPNVPCLKLIRGYWTYEICVGVEVTQYHSIVPGVDKSSVTSLGRLDAAATRAAAAGQQRYTHGDACEPSKQRREATATVSCASGRDRLLEVNEPEPCHYELSLELKAACVPPPAPPASTSAEDG